VTLPVQTMELPDGMVFAHTNAGEARFLYQEVFAERYYLRQGVELRAGDVVFDVGANIGMFTLFAHRECPVTVHAFEPAPVPYAALRANAERHGVAGRFDRCAVSDVAGPELVDTPVVRLSDVIAERGIAAIGLLKIDAAQNEQQVLAGIDEADWPRIRQVVVEVHDLDGSLERVLTLLRGHSFTVVAERDPLLTGTGIHQVTAIREDG
jgi:31-O-methyltransferase